MTIGIPMHRTTRFGVWVDWIGAKAAMDQPDFLDRAQALYDAFEGFVAENPYVTSLAFGDTLYFEVEVGQIDALQLVVLVEQLQSDLGQSGHSSAAYVTMGRVTTRVTDDPEPHAFMGTPIYESSLARMRNHKSFGVSAPLFLATVAERDGAVRRLGPGLFVHHQVAALLPGVRLGLAVDLDNGPYFPVV